MPSTTNPITSPLSPTATHTQHGWAASEPLRGTVRDELSTSLHQVVNSKWFLTFQESRRWCSSDLVHTYWGIEKSKQTLKTQHASSLCIVPKRILQNRCWYFSDITKICFVRVPTLRMFGFDVHRISPLKSVLFLRIYFECWMDIFTREIVSAVWFSWQLPRNNWQILKRHGWMEKKRKKRAFHLNSGRTAIK